MLLSNSTKKTVRAEISEEQKEEIKEAFDIADQDAKGLITKKQFKFGMRGLGIEPKKGEIIKYFKGYLEEGNTRFNYNNFYSFISEKFLDRDPLKEIKTAYKVLSNNNTQKITTQSLLSLAKDLGEEISIEEISNIVKEMDKDKDGAIGEDDFIKVMRKSHYY